MPIEAHDSDHPDAHQADALRVLVVDDSAVSRVLVEAALAELGHVCQTARDGHEALQQVMAGDWDLVVSDLQMPAMDGLALARALRAMPGERGRLPMIAMTAEDGADSRRRCLAAGFDDWLAKPVDAVALAAAIERVGTARAARTMPARAAISGRVAAPGRAAPGRASPARG